MRRTGASASVRRPALRLMRESRSWAFWLDLAVKAALIALLLFSVFSGLERFEGKAMTGRALTYPLAALVVPAAWWLVRRRRGATAYPYALDILLVLPFLIDVAGNALDLYDTVDWWDDANHFVNWGLLTAAFGQLLVRLGLGPVVSAAGGPGLGGAKGGPWGGAGQWPLLRNP